MLNRIVLMGRLTANPELKSTTTGKSVTSFSIAVERNYNKPGEERTTQQNLYVAILQKAI